MGWFSPHGSEFLTHTTQTSTFVFPFPQLLSCASCPPSVPRGDAPSATASWAKWHGSSESCGCLGPSRKLVGFCGSFHLRESLGRKLSGPGSAALLVDCVAAFEANPRGCGSLVSFFSVSTMALRCSSRSKYR